VVKKIVKKVKIVVKKRSSGKRILVGKFIKKAKKSAKKIIKKRAKKVSKKVKKSVMKTKKYAKKPIKKKMKKAYKKPDKLFKTTSNIPLAKIIENDNIQNNRSLNSTNNIRILPSKREIEIIVKKAFNLYDIQKSGKLERPEIRKLLNDACAELGAPNITESQLDEVIKTVDINGDHKFSFEELFKCIGPILESQLKL